ncbi:MAG: helix-turn-helix transcriptional regulator [Saprospiraceae bacterium]|jgi:AraC-like DNA-binding protein|nr:helix-turn-helix transcriptional regulator [Saprospiraceae bacterium]MBP9210780.1 helix-turn-helix transcriptional regulator [Saprospiraceae bacterium]MBV6473897.1 HTH-type transcriptional activator RhaS [Saprospiraceae bacterium]
MSTSESKNTPKIEGVLCFEDAESQLMVYRQLNEAASPWLVLPNSRVHLLFCLHGPVAFAFSPHYRRELAPDRGYVIYQPDEVLPVQLLGTAEARLIHLSIRLEKLHRLINPAVQNAPVFQPENARHKFYDEVEASGELLMVLHQIDQKSASDLSNGLFFHAKSLEWLSLLYAGKKMNVEACPFLKNEMAVRKIRDAKSLLLEAFRDPPTIPELARSVQLNEFQLKAGFKEIYGMGPYHYLMQYKLEMARKLLTEQKLQVKQVAHEIGYSNTSHFIEAFKKQYGITPKKLLAEP